MQDVVLTPPTNSPTVTFTKNNISLAKIILNAYAYKLLEL